MNQSYEFSTRRLNQLELRYECLSLKMYSYCIDHFCHDAFSIICMYIKTCCLHVGRVLRFSEFIKLFSLHNILDIYFSSCSFSYM